MANYITTSELQSFVWATISQPQALLLVDLAEALFNKIIGSDGLLTSEKTAYFDAKEVYKYGGRVLYSPTYKPTEITTINGEDPGVLNTDYTIVGRKITFKEYLTVPTTFPDRLTMVYTSWVDDVPTEVKTCCLYIAKGMYTQKEQMDVASFRQDLLSVNYTTSKTTLEKIVDPSEVSFINIIANKYIVTQTYAI